MKTIWKSSVIAGLALLVSAYPTPSHAQPQSKPKTEVKADSLASNIFNEIVGFRCWDVAYRINKKYDIATPLQKEIIFNGLVNNGYWELVYCAMQDGFGDLAPGGKSTLIDHLIEGKFWFIAYRAVMNYGGTLEQKVAIVEGPWGENLDIPNYSDLKDRNVKLDDVIKEEDVDVIDYFIRESQLDKAHISAYSFGISQNQLRHLADLAIQQKKLVLASELVELGYRRGITADKVDSLVALAEDVLKKPRTEEIEYIQAIAENIKEKYSKE